MLGALTPRCNWLTFRRQGRAVVGEFRRQRGALFRKLEGARSQVCVFVRRLRRHGRQIARQLLLATQLQHAVEVVDLLRQQ